jgi:hypothetical protein
MAFLPELLQGFYAFVSPAHARFTPNFSINCNSQANEPQYIDVPRGIAILTLKQW